MHVYNRRHRPGLLRMALQSRKIAFIIFLATILTPALGQTPFAQPLSLEKIKDDLYVIPGDGGNTTVYVTDEGVILVDTKFERNYDDLMAKLKTVTDKPVRYILNTHAHGDHTGGNVNFPSATIIAHKNARATMVAGQLPGLPEVTFTDEIAVNLGAKQVVAYYFGRAHTNGDAWVYFPALKVLASGDAFNNGLGTGGTGGTYGLAVNHQTGGSIVDMTKTLDEVLKLDFDVVIPGHGPLAQRPQFVKWRTEVEAVRNRIRQMVRDGKSKDDLSKMLVSEFAWDPDGQIIPRSIDGLMNELK